MAGKKILLNSYLDISDSWSLPSPLASKTCSYKINNDKFNPELNLIHFQSNIAMLIYQSIGVLDELIFGDFLLTLSFRQ